MNNIAIVFQLAKKDILNPRYYRRLVLCFFIILVYFVLFLGESMEFARELGLRINVLEPILSLLATDFTHILFMGALLFLISDAPFRDKGDYYIVYRVGRLRWLSAKIMVMVYFVLLFVLVALLASLVFTLPAPEFKLTFSEFVQRPNIGGVNVGRQIYLGIVIEDFFAQVNLPGQILEGLMWAGRFTWAKKSSITIPWWKPYSSPAYSLSSGVAC